MIKVRNEKDPLNAVYESMEYKEISRASGLDFPLILDVEITARCNLDCFMCARQIKTSRVMGDMDDSIFWKIIDQSAQYKARLIRFSGYGEALMHKKFPEFLRYAKKKGILTHLTTNGHLLNEKLCEDIIKAPLDKIKFSFQGTNESEYSRMRATKGYKKLVENIKMLKKMRENFKSDFPIIQIATTVLDETEDKINEFYSQWEGIADNIYHLPTSVNGLEGTLFKKEHEARSYAKILDSTCMEVLTKMSIWNDGYISACCGDHLHQLVLGDVREKSLKEIWMDAPARGIRELLNRKTPASFNDIEKKKYPFCAGCQSMYIERPQ